MLGEKIIAPIARLQEVRPIVRHCHEHFDGSGYPDGLVGDAIPLESRIILVCDAFHAMTTDRPYRKRLSEAEACRRRAASVRWQRERKRSAMRREPPPRRRQGLSGFGAAAPP